MLKLLQSLFLSFFLLTSLGSTLDAGIVKKTAKAGAVYGATKVASNTLKKNKDKIFTKKTVNDKTVYQRDIDPNLVAKDKYGNEIKNIDRMKKGQAPYVNNNGKTEQVQLHHSQQKNSGPLFEVKESTHLGKNSSNGNNALHPYGKKQNPNDPVDRATFDKKERPDYWKNRATELTDKENK